MFDARFLKALDNNPTVKNILTDPRAGDSPKNGMLLCSDAHLYYDDFQWSVWYTVNNGRKIHKVYTFEKNGADFVKGHKELKFPKIRKGDDMIAHEPLLFREHFKLALWTHVGGFGKVDEKVSPKLGVDDEADTEDNLVEQGKDEFEVEVEIVLEFEDD
ncbi:hypothetical protein H0H81_007133 [Sphagnurus paluster]|uniref:HNH nuclease domain-containing protein n=1 Tax=Sphagnurus paluster TaxID=117069 RepID=A0A9P7K522_9AGAR|nr:hypothetical protein H0H81_007133 [Sphagnurus paluster]